MFKSNLFPHQIEMLKFLEEATPEGGGCLFAQMGLGKTRTVIAYIDKLFFNQVVDKVLVITPKSILKNWAYEIEESSDLTYTILTDKKPNLDAQIQLINYDMVFRSLVFLKDQHYGLMVLDESTYVKNRWSKRTKSVLELSKSIRLKVLMTGTPITQSVEDIFSQYLILDGGKTFGYSLKAFREKYMYNVSRNPRIQIWKDKKSMLSEIKEKMYKRAITPDASKVQLPEKRKKLITVNLTHDQSHVYNELFMNDIATLDMAQLTAKEIITKYIKFRQICSGFFLDDSGNIVDFEVNPKLNELLAQIEQLRGQRIVIWRNFVHEGELIKRNIKDVIVFDDNPFEQIQKFNSTPGAIGLASISQIQYGLNIYADVAIYFGNTFSFSSREQSEARHIRLNSVNKSVLYLDIIAERTIEETIFKFQRNRKDISDNLLKKAKMVLYGESLDDNLLPD